MKSFSPISTKQLISFIHQRMKKMSLSLIYSVLLMFYAYKSEDTPSYAKRIILGALAYVLSPIDSIPDLTPFIGFTDDFGIIMFGLVSIACHITDDIKLKAKEKLAHFFKDYRESDLEEVESRLGLD